MDAASLHHVGCQLYHDFFFDTLTRHSSKGLVKRAKLRQDKICRGTAHFILFQFKSVITGQLSCVD